MMLLDLLVLNRAMLQQRANFRLCLVQTFECLAPDICWIWCLNSRWSQKGEVDGADRRRRRKMAWRAKAEIIWCHVWLMRRRCSDLSQSDDGSTPNKHTHTIIDMYTLSWGYKQSLHPWSPQCVHAKTMVPLVCLQQRLSDNGCFTRFQCVSGGVKSFIKPHSNVSTVEKQPHAIRKISFHTENPDKCRIKINVSGLIFTLIWSWGKHRRRCRVMKACQHCVE